MNIRTEVREVENYVKAVTPDKDEQIALISVAQSANKNDEHILAILAIAKRRIINGY